MREEASLVTRDHYEREREKERRRGRKVWENASFQNLFFHEWQTASKLTGRYACIALEGNHIEGSQTVSAYPNFTPIILKPKTPTLRNASLFLLLSARGSQIYACYTHDTDIYIYSWKKGRKPLLRTVVVVVSGITREEGNLTNRETSDRSRVDFSRRRDGQEQRGRVSRHFSSSRTEQPRGERTRACVPRLGANRRRFP